MRICTITCHDVYNYGASLQAFALQTYLREAGHEAEIIDYKPDYLSAHYELSWYINDASPYYARCRKSRFLHVMYVMRRYLMERRTIGRRWSFDSFNRQHLRLTRRYDSYMQLCKEPPEADVYIAGSDQIWNNNGLNNGWDPAFFLRFGRRATRRIAYAASFGSAVECPWVMQQWIRGLDGVAIREAKSLPLLRGCGLEASVVCDPVFLLTPAQWRSAFDIKPRREPYVLVYDLNGSNRQIMDDARSLSESLGCPIHYIAVSQKRRGVRNIVNCSPQRFVSEIAGATVVLADSFHATAFALIFQRDFYAYRFVSAKASERITNLLDVCGLQSRFNPAQASSAAHIDFAAPTARLERYAAESKTWLDEQLSNVGGGKYQ